MPRERSDAALLLDMLQASEAVSRYIAGKSQGEFLNDEILRSAIERKLEIIGEACRKVSKGFQAKATQIPWTKISATRHILAHEYGEVNYDILWQIATVYVPELITSLRPLIPPHPADPDPDN